MHYLEQGRGSETNTFPQVEVTSHGRDSPPSLHGTLKETGFCLPVAGEKRQVGPKPYSTFFSLFLTPTHTHTHRDSHACTYTSTNTSQCINLLMDWPHRPLSLCPGRITFLQLDQWTAGELNSLTHPKEVSEQENKSSNTLTYMYERHYSQCFPICSSGTPSRCSIQASTTPDSTNQGRDGSMSMWIRCAGTWMQHHIWVWFKHGLMFYYGYKSSAKLLTFVQQMFENAKTLKAHSFKK